MSSQASQNQPIISVSGLRGIIGDSLTPVIAARYVAAYSTWVMRNAGISKGSAIPPGQRLKIIVARDGRDSGPMLIDCVVSTLNACGIDALIADIAATPTVGVLVNSLGAAGAVQISASHNPPPYNGMKLFNADGRVIPATSGQQVIDLYRNGEFDWRNHSELGGKQILADTTSAHLERVLSTVDVARIRQKKFRVVLDSNHASGSILGRQLLEALGCQFTLVGDSPDGQFSHPPEPTVNNLAGVTKLAVENQAQAVFCQDPDADRLAIIDELGNYIGEEYTLAITLDHALSQVAGTKFMAPVVTNCSSSRMTIDIANRYQTQCFLSKVGEANVTDLILEKKAVYGGEGSGGPIDPRVGLVRDSFVGMAQTLDAMAATGKSISQIVASLPKYHINKTTVSLPEDTPRDEAVAQAFAKLESHFAGQAISKQDGLRIDWPDAWLLVRPSNTEPIVRAVAEASSPERAQQLCDEAAKVVES